MFLVDLVVQKSQMILQSAITFLASFHVLVAFRKPMTSRKINSCWQGDSVHIEKVNLGFGSLKSGFDKKDRFSDTIATVALIDTSIRNDL